MATCPKCGTRYASNVKICTHDGTVLDDEPTRQDARIGKLLDGKYRLDSYLSQGGMGAVYKATHVMLEKTVVVKLIKPELVTSAEVVRRFQREARAASNLSHPNIVQVYDLGQTDDGTLYIAMEFIDGPSLKDVIRKHGSMPVARIKSILAQVASALDNAHRHNIIHRDLKPHNVMLAKGPDGQEVAKLLDFGIAKTFEEGGTQLTQTGFAIGTPQYMAPEQAAGKEVTPQSDLYSLGIMLYEMLVGEVPFDAPTTAAILIKQLTESPQPPSRRKPGIGISEVLEAITMRCLDKEPGNRFPTAAAFAEALKNADSDATKRRAHDAPTRGVPVPREATTAGAQAVPAPLGQVTAATHITGPPPGPTATAQPAAPPAPAASAAPPPAAARPPAPLMAAPLAAPPPVVAVQAKEGTRPTVPGAALPAVTASPKSSSRTGLYITLGAAAVLVVAVVVAAALQFGLVPGGSANTTATQSASAPAASPASADPPPASAASAASATPVSSPVAAAPAPSAAPSASPTAEAVPPPAAPAPPAPAARPSSPAAVSVVNAPAAPATNLAPSTPARPSAGSSAPAAPAAPAPASRPTPAPPPAAAAAPAAPPVAPARAARPETPTVFLKCEGFPAVCNALRGSLLEQFQKNNIQPVREPARAYIELTANVEIVQERVNRDFGTPMQTRTYTVDVAGETRDGTPVSMPPPKTFSFDPQFGRERLEENVRVLASDVTDKIRAYWNK